MKLKLAIIGLLLVSIATVCFAQRGRSRGRGGWGGWGEPPDYDYKTARESPSHSADTPVWTNTPGFEADTFAFARIHYAPNRDPYISDSAGRWITDFPDSDLNLSFRLQQITSLKVDPNGRVVRLTDPDLFNYPWIYMVEPGRLLIQDDEVPILRKYLLNGGFLMADDFWGEVQWQNFYRQIKRVFPEREFAELPMDHPLFHCVFDLKGPKNKLQIPNIGTGVRSQYDGVTWEYHDGEECTEVHVRAMYDDKGRIMIIATHNTDNGDGWEREGESDYYFHRFSENIGYPLAINIIFYAMTH